LKLQKRSEIAEEFIFENELFRENRFSPICSSKKYFIISKLSFQANREGAVEVQIMAIDKSLCVIIGSQIIPIVLFLHTITDEISSRND
jgi:hypothetical protein